MSKLLKKTILITGAAQRIGAALALELAKKYTIALHYNSSHTGAINIQNQIRDTGGKCELFKANLTNQNEALRLPLLVEEKCGQLTHLINNASTFIPDNLATLNPKDLVASFAIHLFAPIYLTQSFATLASNGSIINILGARVRKNDAKYASYSLAKKSLYNFTEYAAIQFAPKIRVNAIAPGWVLPANGEAIPTQFPNLLERQGTVTELIESSKFLIENEFITGQTIWFDGGESLP